MNNNSKDGGVALNIYDIDEVDDDDDSALCHKCGRQKSGIFGPQSAFTPGSPWSLSPRKEDEIVNTRQAGEGMVKEEESEEFPSSLDSLLGEYENEINGRHSLERFSKYNFVNSNFQFKHWKFFK